MSATATTAPNSRTRRRFSAPASGLLAIVLWSSLALLTARSNGLPAFERLAIGTAVAALAGAIAFRLGGGRAALLPERGLLGAWLTSFVAIFAYHALYFAALAAVPPAEASLIAYLWPLLIVLLSATPAGGGAPLRAGHVAGGLLGLSGTAVLLLGRAGGGGAAAGYAAAFACALVWAVYSVSNRRFGAVPSRMMVSVCAGVAVASALAHLACERWVTPSGGEVLALALLGLGPMGLAFLAWDHATKHGDLPLLGVLSYLAPLVSSLLLVLTGITRPSVALAVAVLLIIGGAAVATGWPGRRSPKPATSAGAQRRP